MHKCIKREGTKKWESKVNMYKFIYNFKLANQFEKGCVCVGVHISHLLFEK